jgi:uncharacterized membrane-anchored protein YhcB (DUF1043 family)
VVGFAALVTGIFIIIVCRLKRKRVHHYVKTTVAMEQVNNALGESQTHLLSSDEEEIP